MYNYNKKQIQLITINQDEARQRLDNYLIKKLKGVPKSHIYLIIRTGQIRINKKRVKNHYKLLNNDILRIPPINLANRKINKNSIPKIDIPIIYEDETLLITNKPSGLASHGGSGISWGVIEILRNKYSNIKYLELIHRLDKDTSGLLMIAKKRSILTKIHELMRNNEIEKEYITLCIGNWPLNLKDVKLPLLKTTNANNEKFVKVDEKGIYSHSIFSIEKNYNGFSLIKVQLKTGKTHQIRVHMQQAGYPIACDEKYGNFLYNKKLKKLGLKRMFLHAYKLKFKHPKNNLNLEFIAPIDKELNNFLIKIKNQDLDF